MNFKLKKIEYLLLYNSINALAQILKCSKRVSDDFEKTMSIQKYGTPSHRDRPGSNNKEVVLVSTPDRDK